MCLTFCFFFFFFNDTATTEIYTLSLHDALPISPRAALIAPSTRRYRKNGFPCLLIAPSRRRCPLDRSEEHTSELQSQSNLVCRLLLEKKKNDYFRICNRTIIRNDMHKHTLVAGS